VLNVGAGVPDAVTGNDPDVPTIKVVLVPLVNDGGTSMVISSVPELVEAAPAPLAVTLLSIVPLALPLTLTSRVSVG
jgi:hypothetical protein